MVDLDVDERGRRRRGRPERKAPSARLEPVAGKLDEAGLDRDLGRGSGEAQVLGTLPGPQDERGGLGRHRAAGSGEEQAKEEREQRAHEAFRHAVSERSIAKRRSPSLLRYARNDS
ncbi:MAG TPA: hypothetical protein VF548_05245 [Allosphingosinicella sp.]|jgi:hypothetical protein